MTDDDATLNKHMQTTGDRLRSLSALATKAEQAEERMVGVDRCQTCREVGRKGYCALSRCYCGHPTCPAFESYVDLSAIPLHTPASKTTKKPARSSWDDREDSTWIDQL